MSKKLAGFAICDFQQRVACPPLTSRKHCAGIITHEVLYFFKNIAFFDILDHPSSELDLKNGSQMQIF